MNAGVRIAIALCFLGACKSKGKEEAPSKTAGKGTAAAAVKPPDATPAPPPAPDAAPPAPDAAPAVKTKVIKLKEIGNDHAFELDAPEETTVEETPFSEESFASADLHIGAIDISVAEPEGGHSDLENAKNRSPTPEILRADADPDGYTLIYSDKASDGSTEFGAEVDRPELNVLCGSWALKSRADADTVATVCRTIRAMSK